MVHGPWYSNSRYERSEYIRSVLGSSILLESTERKMSTPGVFNSLTGSSTHESRRSVLTLSQDSLTWGTGFGRGTLEMTYNLSRTLTPFYVLFSLLLFLFVYIHNNVPHSPRDLFVSCLFLITTHLFPIQRYNLLQSFYRSLY